MKRSALWSAALLIYCLAAVGCDGSDPNDDAPAEGRFTARVTGSETENLEGTAAFTDVDDPFDNPILDLRLQTGEMTLNRSPLPPIELDTGVFFTLPWNRTTGAYTLGNGTFSYDATYVSRALTFPRFIQSGTITFTAVSPGRIAGSFEATMVGDSPFVGPVEITGSFVALSDSTVE